MTRLFFHLCVTVSATMLLLPAAARGALIAYDSFDYAPAGSDLQGNNGGTGFSTGWIAGGFNASNHTNYDIQSSSLTFANLLTNSNRVESASVGAIAGVTRDLVTPLGEPGTTRYVSFLLRPEGTLHAGAFNGFFGVTFEQPGEPELFVGKPGATAIDRYVLEDRGGTLQVASNVAPVVGETALVVVKAEFHAGIDSFTLYMNPIPGGPEPVSGMVKNDTDIGTVQGLTIYSTGGFSIDELRLGETFADVTPVPEPSSIVFAFAGMLTLFGATRYMGARSHRHRACLEFCPSMVEPSRVPLVAHCPSLL